MGDSVFTGNAARSFRVVDLSAAGTLKITTVLSYLPLTEPTWVKWAPDAHIEVINPIPVYQYGNIIAHKAIGYGNVYLDAKSGRILADLFLIRDCPERLDIESQSKKLWPCTGYVLLGGNENGEVARVRLTHVEIGTEPPEDPRLEPLGSPVL